MESLVSIIGSIASIGAAIWAWYEASDSKKSANKARTIKNELIDHRELAELANVHNETHRILKIVSKVGPSCTPSGIRGVKGAEIAKEVEEYSRFINEHGSHFHNFFDNQARELCEGLRPLIEHLAAAKSFDEKRSAGTQIYDLINTFLPEAKNSADRKKEKTSSD